MRKLIIFLILFTSLIQAQGVSFLSGSAGGVAAIDTIPTQFTFTDVIDVAVSSYNQAYIVVAGCDSARFYPASGDTIRAGALGTKTVSPIWLDFGDTLYTFNVASASNSTATHSIVYSSNGTPLDTFSVTTIAGGGGGAYTTDSLVAYWEIADLSNGSVDEWFDGISNIRFTNDADTSFRPIKTTTQIIFDGNDYFRQTTAGGGGALPIINDSLSIEVVMTLEAADTTATSLIFGVRNTRMLALSLTGNRICVYAFNGTTNAEFTNAYSTPFVGTHHIVVTWDGNVANKAKIYLDGSLTADVGNTEGQIAGENRFYLGGESPSSEVPAGTSLPLARIYTIELTSTQVTTNYNSTSVQDLIP